MAPALLTPNAAMTSCLSFMWYSFPLSWPSGKMSPAASPGCATRTRNHPCTFGTQAACRREEALVREKRPPCATKERRRDGQRGKRADREERPADGLARDGLDAVRREQADASARHAARERDEDHLRYRYIHIPHFAPPVGCGQSRGGNDAWRAAFE